MKSYRILDKGIGYFYYSKEPKHWSDSFNNKIVFCDGSIHPWMCEFLHREDGPAIVRDNQFHEYFYHGVLAKVNNNIDFEKWKIIHVKWKNFA